jgi:hypothetical protein
MGLFSGISRLFRKGASKAGSLFKKGVRGVGSLARKGFYEGVEELPRLASLGGGAVGSALGEAGAIAIGQPELVPEAGFIGGRLGSQLGTELGKQIRTDIKKPISRGRLGADPRTYAPLTNLNSPGAKIPKAVQVKPQVRNELEKKKAMRMQEAMRFM